MNTSPLPIGTVVRVLNPRYIDTVGKIDGTFRGYPGCYSVATENMIFWGEPTGKRVWLTLDASDLEALPADILAGRQQIEWSKVASPLDKKRARASKRSPAKSAPLLGYDAAQTSLF